MEWELKARSAVAAVDKEYNHCKDQHHHTVENNSLAEKGKNYNTAAWK
jgi:hypothetical protein